MDLDLEQLKQGLPGMVPFAGTLGLVLEEARPGRVQVALPFQPALANHLGTLHAGATFSLMETTGGAAALVTFGEMASRLLVAAGRIQWLKRIAARATAVAEVPPGLRDRVLEEVRRDGKSFFSLDVTVTNESGEVAAQATFEYRLKPPG